MSTFFDQLRRCSKRPWGRVLADLAMLLLVFGGTRFEAHAHAVDANYHAHELAHDHDHEHPHAHAHAHAGEHAHADADVLADPAGDLALTVHLHDMGTVAALPSLALVSPIRLLPHSVLPVLPCPQTDPEPAAPPIRPPIA